MVVAERVRAKIHALRFVVRGTRVPVTASFGIAEALDVARREGRVTRRNLIAAADVALYAAKGAGRDCVMVEGSPPSGCDLTDLPTPPESERKSA